MKKIFMKWAFFMLCMAVTMPAMAQFNVKALKGAQGKDYIIRKAAERRCKGVS